MKDRDLFTRLIERIELEILTTEESALIGGNADSTLGINNCNCYSNNCILCLTINNCQCDGNNCSCYIAPTPPPTPVT